jgi:hypothetical protein
MRPCGARAIVAESLLVKHQLVILNRGRERAPSLHPMDRVIAGLSSLFIRPRRLIRIAVVLRPSTMLAFHASLVKRKYRQLFSPKCVSSDHDPLFRFHRWKANLRILEATEVTPVPYLPISHPFVERLIGTIRREYLDFVPFWTARDLENKLLSFKEFYNDRRCHYALGGDTPGAKAGKIRAKLLDLHSYRWRTHCRGFTICRSRLEH